MGDAMTFPETFEEFAEQYKIVDKEQVYTNGTELIPIFRVKQWLEHMDEDVTKNSQPTISEQMQSFYQGILDSERLARIAGIKANAVFINDKLYFSKIPIFGNEIPIICGLKAFYTTNLPEDTLFAVGQAHGATPTKDEHIKQIEEENAQLKRRLSSIGNILEEEI